MRYNVEAVVVKSINYGDADKIFTLISKNHGKISALAKGVRKISSKRAGSMDTLNHVILGLSESNSGFKTITEVKLINSYRTLKETFENYKQGYYILELVTKLLEEDQQNSDVFDLLTSTLILLQNPAMNRAYIVNTFEIKLMKLLGYEMCLDKCFVCGKELSDDWVMHRYSPSTGAVFCENCQLDGYVIDKPVAHVLKSLSKYRYSPTFLPADMNKADGLIKDFVNEVLGKEPKTMRFFSV